METIESKNIETKGNVLAFKLISQIKDKRHGWNRLVKAMEIENSGCVIQTSTQVGDHISEALVFVPNCVIKEDEFGQNYISHSI